MKIPVHSGELWKRIGLLLGLLSDFRRGSLTLYPKKGFRSSSTQCLYPSRRRGNVAVCTSFSVVTPIVSRFLRAPVIDIVFPDGDSLKWNLVEPCGGPMGWRLLRMGLLLATSLSRKNSFAVLPALAFLLTMRVEFVGVVGSSSWCFAVGYIIPVDR